MKKKVFLICSVISLLLVAFPVSVCADETTPNTSSGSEGAVIPFLDSYFYDNYDILPYIESSGTQYIDTGITGSSSLVVDLVLSDLVPVSGVTYGCIFGSLNTDPNSDRLYLLYYYDNDVLNFAFGNSSNNYSFTPSPYSLYHFVSDMDKLYLNDQMIVDLDYVDFTGPSISIFARHTGSSFMTFSIYKLYKFSIYDSSLDANDEEIGYVRYYYPAKAKTSGTIGLYDAVSKTFFPSLGSQPFANPTDDKVLNFQISGFIGSGLGWIGDIFDFVIATPILLFFMAIGLAGVAFRWTKRILHF